MKPGKIGQLLILSFSIITAVASAAGTNSAEGPVNREIGRIEISTIPFKPDLQLRTATYTPSGNVLVAYAEGENQSGRHVNLAVMDDDGTNLRPFFSEEIPPREKDNGIRFMVFPDNQRIFLGDFIIECVPNIDKCNRSTLLPVEYPEEVAGGEHIGHRWSEIIVAPDNEHISWTTLLSNYSAVVFTGKLEKQERRYTIVNPRIISTLDAYRKDPNHPDGVLPNPVRGGEVKQFVEGGTAISMVGAKRRDTPDSVVQHLRSGNIEQITDTPGYNETTIFSPDERLGIVMTTRFSESTNMAILGLMPRPYPVSLNMWLNMHIYTYAVTGVREVRLGNIGPALIDIRASKSNGNYRGIDLNTEEEWVYYSPMSWHPDGKKAMWLEGKRGGDKMRMRVVRLRDYEPVLPAPVTTTPDEIPYAVTDLSEIKKFLRQGLTTDIKIYGRHSGHIEYRRTARGKIEKVYFDFSDDGKSVYNGSETTELIPQGFSTYRARVTLTGPKPGEMDLKITFGPLQNHLPARLVFSEDETGKPLTFGYAEFNGRRLNVDKLVP